MNGVDQAPQSLISSLINRLRDRVSQRDWCLKRIEALMPKILVMDSGLGGLSVLKAILADLPGAKITYLADTDAFPYGRWEAEPLCRHLIALMGKWIDHLGPDVVVIACNTATTVALARLREAFPKVNFVGTVPAIKPAAAHTQTGRISVLATPGTVKRDYTQKLIEDHAKGAEVTLVGAPQLASLAEDYVRGVPVSEDEIRAEIEPAFVGVRGDNKRTDHIVLGCTHYPLILPELTRLAPWPVTWVDPAPAIAAQVRRLSRAVETPTLPSEGATHMTFVSTDGQKDFADLALRLCF